MESQNHEYLVEVRGERFPWFDFKEVLPEALVESARAGNQLSISIIVAWARRKRGRKMLFAQIPDEVPAVLMFTVLRENI